MNNFFIYLYAIIIVGLIGSYLPGKKESRLDLKERRFDMVAGGIFGVIAFVIALIITMIFWGLSDYSGTYFVTIAAVLLAAALPIYLFPRTYKKYHRDSSSLSVSYSSIIFSKTAALILFVLLGIFYFLMPKIF